MYLIWKIFRKTSFYIEYITFTFILLFLWDQFHNLFPIFTVGGLFFVFSPIGALLGTLITNKISPKISLLLSSLLFTIQIVVFILFNEHIDTFELVLIGSIGGLASGLKTIPEYVLERFYEKMNQEYQVQANKAFWGETIKLATTFTSAYLVYKTEGFNLLFEFILFTLVANSLFIALLTPHNSRKATRIADIFKFPGSNPDKHLIAKSELIDGIYEGINATIIPVALILFVKDYLDWGFVNLVLITFSIFFAAMLSKTRGNSTYRGFYGISSFLFPAIGIFIALDYNIFILLGYMLAMTINEVAGTVGYNTTIEDIIDQDEQKDQLLPEYKLLSETFFEIGRAIPMLIFLLLNLDFEGTQMIQIALALGSLLPILVISTLGKQLIVEKD